MSLRKQALAPCRHIKRQRNTPVKNGCKDSMCAYKAYEPFDKKFFSPHWGWKNAGSSTTSIITNWFCNFEKAIWRDAVIRFRDCYLVEAEEAQVTNHTECTDSGSSGDLTCDLQANLHNLQRVGKNDLRGSSLKERRQQMTHIFYISPLIKTVTQNVNKVT